MRGKLFFLAPLIIVLLLAIMLFAAPTSSASGLLAGETICLDPGHGGSDPGATNEAFGLDESIINLDIAFRLQELLSLPELQTDNVALTRTDDSTLTNSDRYTFCNSINATIVVSIHTNSVADEAWDGSMTLYAPNREPDLAQAIQDVMYPYLRDKAPVDIVDFRDFGISKFASGVLFKCDALAAAMVEPVFMSNPKEAALLEHPIDTCGNAGDDNCRREQIAQAVFSGIKNYFDVAQLIPMQVARVEMRYQQSRAFYIVTTEVQIRDEVGAISGATVLLDITKPDGTTTSVNIVSDANGLASYRLRSKLSGLYIASIANVSKSGYEYVPTLEDFATLEIP